MSLQDELNDAVSALDVEPGYEINDDAANRLLRKLRSLQRKRAEVVAVAGAELDRIEAWRDERLRSMDAERDRLTGILDGFMRMLAERHNTRTVKLPNGSLRLRPPTGRLEVVDLDALLAWANGREDFADIIETKHSARRAAIKHLFSVGPVSSTHEDVEFLVLVDDNGEAIPGIALERATQASFTIGLESEPMAQPQGDTYTVVDGTGAVVQEYHHPVPQPQGEENGNDC